MNRQIRRVGIALLVCYLAVFVQLNRIQVVDADKLNNDPFNSRRAQREYNRPRGQILSAEGAVLARSEDYEGQFYRRKRVYPEAELFGHITGYLSFNYGFTGVEQQYNDDLSGQSFQVQVNSLEDMLVAGNENVGNVTLTVRKDLQQVARQSLGEREGAVVLLDPRTGELLALWSFPSFDPNLIASPDREVMETAWSIYNLAQGKPLLAHSYRERYFPGSTFKIVTAGTGLQTGKVTPESPVYDFRNGYLPPQTTKPIQNFGNGNCGGALFTILRESCNSAFAEMGQSTIGAVDMVRGAESFGFNQSVPIDLPNATKSVFPTDVIATPNPPKLAQASIGQNDVAATPLQIALVAGAPGNGGRIMKPHVLKDVRTSEGKVARSFEPEEWLAPMSPEHAQTLRDAMLGVVSGGTAAGLQIPGYEIGGKTGTAQLGNGLVHTWIAGFAGQPGQAPSLAFAVVVFNQAETSQTTGGAISVPIARTVLQAALPIPR